MIRISRIVALAAPMACAFALPARADLPKVFDQLPPEALVVVATPSLNQLDRETGKLLAAMDMAQISTPNQLLEIANLKNGMNLDGAAALVLMPGDMNGTHPPMFTVLPVSNYEALLGNFDAKPSGGAGLDSLTMGGQKLFAKKLDGGYAAFSPTEAVMTAFTGKAGNMAAFNAAVGKAGMGVADKAEVVAVCNIQALAPYMDAWSEGMKKGIEGAAMNGGPQAAQAQAALDMMQGLVNQFKKDGRTLVLGLDAGAPGVAFDLAVTFADGSEMTKLLQGAGHASSLLKNIPNKPFLLAGAFDLSHPASKGLLDKVTAMGKAAGAMNMFGGVDPAKMIGNVNGEAMAVYPNPAGPMAGVFANTVAYFDAKDPKAFAAEFRTMMEAMSKADGPIKMTSTFTPGELKLDGATVDGFTTTLPAGSDPESLQIAQVMGVLYGAGGMSGYLATTDKGVYQTMSKNSQLLKDALGASKGGSLADDASIKRISARLPEGRIAEGYIGIKSILDQVMPFVQMMMPVQFDIPAELSPLAGGIAAENGAFRATGVIPADILKLGGKVYQQMQMMSAPGMADEEEKPEGEKKPRF